MERPDELVRKPTQIHTLTLVLKTYIPTQLLVAVSAVALALGLAVPAIADDVVLDEVATGFSAPVYVDAPTGEFRLFVVEQGGVIRIIDNGAVLPDPFLDISSRVRWSGEQGLLGIAFHPDFASNGRFFVHYSNNSGNTVIAEYRVGSDPNRADPSSARTLLTVTQPAGNHNGGSIAFGSDGYLYIGLGDGGGGNDTYGNGQNTGTLLGSILRIDADSGAAAPGNPFGKIWAYGLRNPWRMSFDSVTGALYIGDVGQSAREEITVVTTPGANLGWPIMEGSICRPPTSACTLPPDYVGPIYDYQLNPGPRSVTGGYVYRGSDLPDLVGTYFYADIYEGEIRSFENVGGTAKNPQNWSDQLGRIPYLASFGTDGAEELYAVSLSGSIYRFVAGVPRLSGDNRYATSVEVARQAFPSPRVAYVVTGENWPDALMAGSRGDGPVLLTRPDDIPSVVRSELTRIGTLDEIFVIGGPAAVSDRVVTQLAPYATTITRLAGATRYETAAAFSQRFQSAPRTVYVATGENHPDALVTAAAAGASNSPLLLTGLNSVPTSTTRELSRLQPTEIIVVGGEAVISPGVFAILEGYATTVRRIAGRDRFATASAVSADTFGPGTPVYVATGLDAPDALVSAAAAVSVGGPVLLLTDSTVPTPTSNELVRLRPPSIFLVGGVAVVDRQTQADLAAFVD